VTERELKLITDELDLDDEMDAADEEIAKLGAEVHAAPAKAAPAQKAAAQTPAPIATPAPTPAAPKHPLGLGKDGVYRHTAAQLRDPTWCYESQAERDQAKSVELVKE
jgi:hypothetical protein